MYEKETVLVTGASSGIGFELAKIFAKANYNLVLVAQNKERLEDAVKKLSEFNVKITLIVLDLSRNDAAEELYKKIKNQNLDIDVLVNNAGFGEKGEFIKLDVLTVENMMRVNMLTLTLLTRLFGEEMVKKRRGKILNVASVAAFFPGPLMAVYYATKAYVLSLGEALSEEFVGTGVTLTTLCPGPTRTNFQKRAHVENSLLFSAQIADPRTVAAAGYEGLVLGKPVVVPGIMNRLEIFFSRFVPQIIQAKIVKGMHLKKT